MPRSYNSKAFAQARRQLSQRETALQILFERHPHLKFEPKLEREPYESLVRAIAHQQLNGKAAETILARMLALFPGQSFPEPAQLAALDPALLRSCGYSHSKVRSILDIAAHACRGVIPSREQVALLENDAIVEKLLPIYGVGRWTVEMMLIFQLGRLDVWPVDDFGVRKGYQLWMRKRTMPTARDLKKVAVRFAPFETLVALTLWREADLAKQNPSQWHKQPPKRARAAPKPPKRS